MARWRPAGSSRTSEVWDARTTVMAPIIAIRIPRRSSYRSRGLNDGLKQIEISHITLRNRSCSIRGANTQLAINANYGVGNYAID